MPHPAWPLWKATNALILALLILYGAAILIGFGTGAVGLGRFLTQVALLMAGVLLYRHISRITNRHAHLAGARRELRTIAAEVPRGMLRVYHCPDQQDEAIVVSPSQRRDQPDRFDVVSRDVIEDLDRAEGGEHAVFTSTTYTVNTVAPTVWRTVGGVRVRAGGELEEPQVGKSSLFDAWRTLQLDTRTGLLTPSREELEGLIRSMAESEGFRDIPRQGSQPADEG